VKHTRKNKPDRKRSRIKMSDYTCRNHGKCDRCNGDRTHKFVKPEREALHDENEWDGIESE